MKNKNKKSSEVQKNLTFEFDLPEIRNIKYNMIDCLLSKFIFNNSNTILIS